MSKAVKSSSEPREQRGFGLSPKWVPVVIVTAGSVWAIHFVWHTNQNSYGDQDTVVFMNFLIWPLLASALVVAFTSLRGAFDEAEIGLSDYRRLILIAAIPLYATLTVYGGFILSSVVFLVILLPIYGVRNPFILLLVCGLVVAAIWFGFSYLMSVPLPLWPRGVAF